MMIEKKLITLEQKLENEDSPPTEKLRKKRYKKTQYKILEDEISVTDDESTEPEEVIPTSVDLIDANILKNVIFEYQSDLGDWCFERQTGLHCLNNMFGEILRFAQRPKPLPSPSIPKIPIQIAVVGKLFSGRHTQCNLLAQKYQLPIISLNELVNRALISFENKTEEDSLTEEMKLGEEIKTLRETGDKITNTIYCSLFINWLTKEKADKESFHGFIANGFPQNQEQAALIEKNLSGKKKKGPPISGFQRIFYLEGENFAKRGDKILICPETESRYSSSNMPIDEETELRLKKLSNESKEKLLTGLKYDESVEEITEFFEQFEDCITKIDANQKPSEIHATIFTILKEIESKKENDNKDEEEENENEINELEEPKETEDMIRHNHCVQFKALYDLVISIYTQNLQEIMAKLYLTENSLQNEIQEKLCTFKSIITFISPEKLEGISELQTNYNRTSKEERHRALCVSLVTSKIDKLGRYLWELTMTEITYFEKEIQAVKNEISLKTFKEFMNSILKDIIFVEFHFHICLQELFKNLENYKSGVEFTQIDFENIHIPEGFNELSLSLMELFDISKYEDFINNQIPAYSLFQKRLHNIDQYFKNKIIFFDSQINQLSNRMDEMLRIKISSEDAQCKRVLTEFHEAVRRAENFIIPN